MLLQNFIGWIFQCFFCFLIFLLDLLAVWREELWSSKILPRKVLGLYLVVLDIVWETDWSALHFPLSEVLSVEVFGMPVWIEMGLLSSFFVFHCEVFYLHVSGCVCGSVCCNSVSKYYLQGPRDKHNISRKKIKKKVCVYILWAEPRAFILKLIPSPFKIFILT